MPNCRRPDGAVDCVEGLRRDGRRFEQRRATAPLKGASERSEERHPIGWRREPLVGLLTPTGAFSAGAGGRSAT